MHPQEPLQVATDYVFQNRTLTARLRTNDGDLGQIDGVVNLKREQAVSVKSPTEGLRETGHCIFNDRKETTYPDCRNDILQLIDQRDQARIVHIYAAHESETAALNTRDQGVGERAHERLVGLAMAGDRSKKRVYSELEKEKRREKKEERKGLYKERMNPAGNPACGGSK